MTRLMACVVVLALSGAAGADDEDGYGSSADRIIAERDRAAARHDASRATLKDLVKQREEAAVQVYQARRQEFLTGRGGADDADQAQVLLTQARSPLPQSVTTPQAALEERWKGAYETHLLSRSRYDAARIPAAEYYLSVYRLRDAELQLALTRPKK